MHVLTSAVKIFYVAYILIIIETVFKKNKFILVCVPLLVLFSYYVLLITAV
jgi:hypothetical protein